MIWTMGERIAEHTTVTAYCQAKDCRHNQPVDLAQLAVRLGLGASAMPADLAVHCSCSGCGGAKSDGFIRRRRRHPGPHKPTFSCRKVVRTVAGNRPLKAIAADPVD